MRMWQTAVPKTNNRQTALLSLGQSTVQCTPRYYSSLQVPLSHADYDDDA